MDFLVQITREGLALCHLLIPNWGAAIIFLTAAVRLLLSPLQVLAIREQAKIRKLKPDLDRLQAEFKEDFQQLLQRRSILMKASGARPWLSLVAVVIPLPVFLAMYTAISTTEALRTAPFAWIPSLATADPLFILPIAAAFLMWWQSRSSEQSAKAFQFALAAVTFVFLATMPAGLALYSLTSAALQFVVQRAVIDV